MRDSRRGVVLIVVLVLIALLSVTAYTFSDLMLTEREAAELSGGQAQARALVDSAVDTIRIFLMKDRETRFADGGTYDNEEKFRGRIVIDHPDAFRRGRFSVIAPVVDDDGNVGGGIRFGLENESARLNLNGLLLAEAQGEGNGRELLLALPGMTEEIADAMLDWIDEDDEQREQGAEVDYYSGLPTPYAPKNGAFETVEELLLVRGVTPQLLFGLDLNRNALVDPHESGDLNVEADNSDGNLDRGWSAYLTLHGKERNVNSLGLPRIHLNQEDMQQLYDELSDVFSDEWATFIVAYRQNGPYRGKDDGEPAGGGKLDLTKPARFPLSQVLDLIGQKVRVRFEDDDDVTVLGPVFPEGPIAASLYLPELMENATVNESPEIPGRINVNQAPRVVLQGIPGMNDELVEAILGSRGDDLDEESINRKHETWLLTEALVTLEEMKDLMPYVTAGGDVYRTQVVGYFDGGGASARLEIIIDGTHTVPELLMWRDISHLGRGFALETLGIDLSSELE